MNKNLFLPLLLLIGICSCSDSIQELAELSDSQNLTNANISERNHFVTLSDISALVKAQGNAARSRGASDPDAKISFFIDESNDTLLYICDNPNGGWVIFSSDTRVPPIVAQGGKGNYSSLMENENAAAWVATIADDMKAIKQADDGKLKFTEEQIDNNRKFWESISSPNDFVNAMLEKEGSRSIIPYFPSYRGHYELIASNTYPEVLESISRLTTTDWSQEHPYNMYCPLRTDDQGRALAGCVAIAGAQMLFFLHNHFGVPQEAPSEAYCYGNFLNYSWDQTNYTSSIWAEMAIDGAKAAPLIANVGKRVGMNYGNIGSGACTVDLVNNVFANYGISCNYMGLNNNANLLKASLENGIPVLLNAWIRDQYHAFLTDRYKLFYYTTMNQYRWVYDERPTNPDGTLIPVPCIDDRIEYLHSDEMYMVGMNWGWGPSFYDPNEWFSLTENWYVSNDSSSREMICNFNVLE